MFLKEIIFLTGCFNFLESNGLDAMQMNRENEMHYNQTSMNLDSTRKYLPFNPEQVNITKFMMAWICGQTVTQRFAGTMFMRSTAAERRRRQIGHVLVEPAVQRNVSK